MKYVLAFILFLFTFTAFAQVKQDTLFIHQKNIISKIDTLFDIRTKPTIEKRYFHLRENNPLNGFYKISTGKETYFVTQYTNGFEDNSVFNYIKYYDNGQLHTIKIKGNTMFGSHFLYVPKYSCEQRKFTGFYVDLVNEELKKQVRIKQKFRNKYVLWKVIFEDGNVHRVQLNRAVLNDCYD
ncbi:hypothetical protein [Kordia sp.]|uniref:hypothetical protein n=1 Tax=Kordia sp. TaxID=1965332 RepID=UPI003D2B07D3